MLGSHHLRSELGAARLCPGGTIISLRAPLAAFTEPREGKLTYPSHLELHGVCVSPVHEGGIHFAAHAQATVPVVYVKAASSAFLETHVNRGPVTTPHPCQAPPVPCSDAMDTVGVPRILAADDNTPQVLERGGKDGKGTFDCEDDARFHSFKAYLLGACHVSSTVLISGDR